MGKIDTSEWKEFRVGELFAQERGKEKAPKQNEPGDCPLIQETNNNNGFDRMVVPTKIIKGNSITVSINYAQNVFYQADDFCASVNIAVLRNNHLNRYNSQFVCSVLRNAHQKFDYTSKISKELLNKEMIMLPVDKTGQPDWAYMESYMANLETKVAESLTLLQAAKDAEKKKVDTREWGEFRVGELFDAALSKDDIRPKVIVEGNTPLVSSGKENNGIIALIDNKNARLWEANTLTVDMFGKVFYQEQPYYAVSHGRVNILMPRMPMTKHCMQFIGCAIERVTTDKYAFSEMCTGTKLLKDVILLPKDKTGQPDWAYMEEYMRKVEERVKATIAELKVSLSTK